MGHHGTSDIVPFVAHNVHEGDFFGSSADQDQELFKVLYPESWMEDFATDEQRNLWDETGVCDIGLVRGWKLVEVAAQVGKRSRLYTNWFQKDGNNVYIINECQYSNGGSHQMSVIGNDRQSITAFLADFNDLLSDYGRNRVEIEETDTAEQWG